MRWRTLTCAAISLACAATALAQVPGPPFEPTKENSARLRWLDYKMMAGRVVATSNYPAGMNISFGPTVSSGRREHLQILILKDRASLKYELDGDGQQLSIALAEDGTFSVDRVRAEPPWELHFLQPPGRPLSLTVQDEGVEDHYEADSFWHLYLAEPVLLRRHLIPVLEILRPTWQLATTGWAIEEALLVQAQQPRQLNTQRWKRLVAQLGDPKFARRQTAQRELLNIGPVILPFLEGLDDGRLDAEQLSRIDTLIAKLSVGYEDTTDRMTTWLVADTNAWLALLSRDQEAKRRVAAHQLEVLLDRPLEFEPAATPEVRNAQIKKLRVQLARSTRATSEVGAKTAPSVPPPGVKR